MKSMRVGGVGARGSRAVMFVTLGAALGLLMGAERAEAQSSFSLDYRVPESCPAADVLGAEVAMRAGRQVFGTGPVVVVRVFEDTSGTISEFVGTLEVEGSTSGARAAACRDLIIELATQFAARLQGQGSRGLAQPATPQPQTVQPVQQVPAAPTGNRQHVLTVMDGDASVPLRLHQVVGTASGVVSGFSYGRGWGSSVVSTTAYTQLCEAPCQLSLDEGQYELAVGLGDRTPRNIRDVLRFDSDMTLQLGYQSRRGIRAGGWVLFAGGVAASLAIMIAPLAFYDASEEGSSDDFLIYLGVGTGVLIATTIVSLIMILQKDRASVERVAEVLREGVRF